MTRFITKGKGKQHKHIPISEGSGKRSYKRIGKKISYKKITAEEVNRNREDWFVTLSSKNAKEYAGARKNIYRLPNGSYAVRKPKKKTSKSDVKARWGKERYWVASAGMYYDVPEETQKRGRIEASPSPKLKRFDKDLFTHEVTFKKKSDAVKRKEQMKRRISSEVRVRIVKSKDGYEVYYRMPR